MIDERSFLLGLGTHSPYVHQLFYHLFKADQSLLRSAEQELKMASVCQKCGVPGYEELLVYCRKCRTSAEHRYCLNKFPKRDEKVRWFCEQCEPISSNIASRENLVVDSGRSKDDLEYNEQQPNHSDSIPRPRDKKQKISSHGKNVSLPKLQNGFTSGSECTRIEGESSPCTSPEQSEGRKSKKLRRLILAEEDNLDLELQSDRGDQNVTNKATELSSEPILTSLPPHTIPGDEVMIGSRIVALETSVSQATVQENVHDDPPNVLYNQASVNQNLYSPAQPIVCHVWRGYISFGDEKYGPLTAHISSKACERVFDAAKLLPPILHMEKLSRLDSWPNGFKNAPPTDDKIGLYFLPECRTFEPVLDQILNDAIQKDLVFKFMLDEVELLVFSSTILPKDHHRFKDKYFLWGVFRRRQVSVSASSLNCHLKPSEMREESQRMEVSYEHAGDKEEEKGREDEYSDITQYGNFDSSPLSVLQHLKSNELPEEIRRTENLSKDAGDKGGIDADDELEELEEGEICDDYVEREEGEIIEDLNDSHCLKLFPMAVEDMGIVSKVGTGNTLNLELGLSRRAAGNGGGHGALLRSFV